MDPVPYVDLLNQRYREQGFPAYQWTINDDAPLTTPSVPLSGARVSMLTSGGVSHCSMSAWNPDARNDFRLDAVDAAADSDDFAVNDSYYDTADALADLNCVFPIDRLRELVDDGVVGSVADRLWSGFPPGGISLPRSVPRAPCSPTSRWATRSGHRAMPTSSAESCCGLWS